VVLEVGKGRNIFLESLFSSSCSLYCDYSIAKQCQKVKVLDRENILFFAISVLYVITLG